MVSTEARRDGEPLPSGRRDRVEWEKTSRGRVSSMQIAFDGGDTPTEHVESDLQVLNAKKIGHEPRLWNRSYNHT